MGFFDKLRNQKVEAENKKEIEETLNNLKQQEFYFNEFKDILGGLNDLDKKYACLCPSLIVPKKDDGFTDNSKMPVEYRRHLMNFKETVSPIYHYSRIPSILNDVLNHLKRDPRRLDKGDFLAIRELINNQLDEIESLCSEDFDYVALQQFNRNKCDDQLEDVEEELNKLKASNQFE